MVKRQKPVIETWPHRAAAAAELGVYLNWPTLTTKTMEGWLGDPSCPLPRGRGPVPKVALIVWAFTQKKGPGRPADPASNGAKEAQAAIWRAKAAAISGQSVSVEDMNTAVDVAADALKQDLTQDIPNAVSEMIGKKSPEEILEEHRALATAALNRFSAAARTVRRA